MGESSGAPRLSRRQFVIGAAGLGAVALGGGAYELVRRTSVGAASTDTVRSYISRPDLQPPAVDVLTAPSGAAPGEIFIAPSSGPGQHGPMILDARGDMVWFHPTTPLTSMDFRVATYKGKPVLTWWESLPGRGLGNGRHVIMDASYRQIASFPAGGGRPADLHEFRITSRDTGLVTALEFRRMDIRRHGGSRHGLVLGGVAQELAIPSGRVLWEWRSLDHVPVGDTYATKIGYPWDYFHINSIEIADDGHYLISGRNTWCVYKVDRHTGKVIWRLGGKNSDFTLGNGARFAYQHDARQLHGSTVSVFDNGGAESVQVESQSRGLVLHLDMKAKHASLARALTHKPSLYGRIMGNVQHLSNGNFMVGWGADPHLTEFGADGSVHFDATLPHGGESYRAFRLPWSGKPAEPPVAVSSGKTLYASWNGATDVVAWRLLAGPSADALAEKASVQRQGFETALPLAGERFAAAAALDAAGHELARTAPVTV
ncbi:MAG TPA: arylsulfotransferase family protein [Gaiellaceae bacterium]|nr:arylsulfotransferase family protein [Gaiellaceae bacterium]